MKLGTRLLMAPLLTAVVLLGVSEINAWATSRQTEAGQALGRQRFELLQTLSSSQAQLGVINAGVYRTLALMNSLDDGKVKDARADLARQLGGLKSTLVAAVSGPGIDAALQTRAQAAGVQTDAYLKAADTALDLGGVDPNTGVAAMQQADVAYEKLSGSVAAMVLRIDAIADEAADAAQTKALRLRVGLTLAGLLAAGGALFVAWRAQRRMVAELASAAQAANAVAAGNLQISTASDRADELGDLLRALDRMAAQLSDSICTVRDSAQSIHHASSEIATGNLDLSQRTERAASNLQQTAGSMGELTGTVRVSAENAATANQLAASAAQVAQRGGEVVGQVVSTMQEINQSSKTIADIIGTIDGIAFQTNILALNAAVEAARAGEQGRGFAVVAAEVRSLAQRSAAAAREIKGLIDASVGRVETGARLVQDAGSTMTEIVASVQRVSDMIAQISTSTVAQSDGIHDVNEAVGRLDQMTQQNAALVEQSAAAAESLKEQASTLAGVVSGFRTRT